MPAREIEQPALAAGCSETLCLEGFTTGSSAGSPLPSSAESPLVVEVVSREPVLVESLPGDVLCADVPGCVAPGSGFAGKSVWPAAAAAAWMAAACDAVSE